MNIFILFKVELDGLVVEKDCQCILDLLHIVQVPHAGFLEFKQNFFKQFIYKIFFFCGFEIMILEPTIKKGFCRYFSWIFSRSSRRELLTNQCFQSARFMLDFEY